MAYSVPAEMDSEISLRICEKFVTETKALQEGHRNLILTMDGYDVHTS